MAVSSAGSLAGALVPLGIGAAAAAWGLSTAMWLFLAGSVALLLGIPRMRTNAGRQGEERATTRSLLMSFCSVQRVVSSHPLHPFSTCYTYADTRQRAGFAKFPAIDECQSQEASNE